MPWTFFNSSGEALTNFGPVALTDLDIDGGTDVGEAIVDADLFIVDNGAGGTNRKTAASRIKTYVGGARSVAGDTDNGIITWVTSDNTFAAEAALTYDGTTLTIPGQIAFPASQSASGGANVLDDYEEGSFTPAIADASLSASESQAYGNQQGQYVKIGRQVFITGYVKTSSLGSLTTSENVSIMGLPCRVAATTGGAAVAFGEFLGLTITAGHTLVGSMPANTTRIDVHLTDSTGGISSLLLSEWTADGGTFFSAHYRV